MQAKQRAATAEAELQNSDSAYATRAKAAEKRAADSAAALARAERRAEAASRWDCVGLRACVCVSACTCVQSLVHKVGCICVFVSTRNVLVYV